MRGYLRITDRIEDIFIVGRFNCYPAEIENPLLGLPGVAQAAVNGIPDDRLGEVGMAFLVPRHVEIVDALPMNATGKVTKFVLRERARERL